MLRTTRVAAALAASMLIAAVAGCGSSSRPQTSNGMPRQFASTALTGASTSVTLDPTFTAALARFGVAPTVVAPATENGATLTFPITGGRATVYYPGTRPRVYASITHSGGLALSARGTKVQIEKFVLTLGDKPTLAGTVLINGASLGSAVTMFDLDSSTTRVAVSGKSATLSGTAVYVDAQAAVALNAALGLSGTSQALPTAAKALRVGTADVSMKS